MSNISWYQNPNINDYYYVRLQFTSNVLNSGTVIISIGWSNTWHIINGTFETVYPPNPNGVDNYYIITVPPVGTFASAIVFIISQANTGYSITIDPPLVQSPYVNNVPSGGGTFYYKVIWNGTAFEISGNPFPFPNPLLCFHSNSIVQTIDKLEIAQNIKSGDLVKLLNGEYKKVIKNYKMYNAKKFYLFKKNCFGDVPTTDVYIHGEHPVSYNGITKTANKFEEAEIFEFSTPQAIYTFEVEDEGMMDFSGIGVASWKEGGVRKLLGRKYKLLEQF